MALAFVLLSLAPALGLANFLAGRSLPSEQTFRVIFEKHVPSGSTSLSAWDEHQTTLFGYSCKGALSFLESSIEVALTDNTGDGELSFGGTKYTIGPDAETTGGIACGQRYNDIHVLVECLVPAGAALPSKAIESKKVAECFGALEKDDFAAASTATLVDDSETFVTAEENGEELEADYANLNVTDLRGDLETRSLRARQCITRKFTYPFNDGAPRKLGKHQQVSSNLKCGSQTCSIGTGQIIGVTHAASFSINVGPWITGGYAVSFSKAYSSSQTCNGNPNDVICIWNYKRHQRYQSLSIERDCNLNFWGSSGRYDITSPTSSNSVDHEHHYCVKHTCRGNGDNWYNDYGSGVW